ncbi:MAG: DUF6754 domain-containing protein [Nitrospiraceae bacterium]
MVPPQQLQVFDTPNDSGGGVTIVWAPAPQDGPDVRYVVMLGEAQAAADAPPTLTGMTVVGDFPSNSHYVREVKTAWWTHSAPKTFHRFDIKNGKGQRLTDGARYVVSVSAMRGAESMMAGPLSAVPEPNWFNWNQINNLAIVVIFGLVVLGSIQAAKRREIFLRRIPGLDAVDEAIGRATELGKPILYLTGAGDMSEPSTVAAAVILGRVAKRVAAYETDLMVPHRDPIVMAVCQEITKQSYLEAGKPDVFKEDSNFFITTDQFSYTAAVDGIMLRKKPAANFFMGSYFAESLLLTETGASTGAIQIAGTDSDHQLPFFVTTCDYTLIGEELYAASAYLSREPVQLGTLRGQDIGKACILCAIGLGTVLATASVLFHLDVSVVLDLLKDLK